MATTTNFGWSTPDDSSAVKDGASAIRSLGTAVDTTMQTMVPKSAITAKGDLIVGTSAGAYVAQGVGANGTVLTANSAQADGVEWAAPSSGGMTLLGSAVNISGTSTVSFNSIDQSYVDLYVYITGLQNLTTNMSVNMTLNNNSTNANYTNQYLTWISSNPTGSTTTTIPFLTPATNFLNPDGRFSAQFFIHIKRYASASSRATFYDFQGLYNGNAVLGYGAFSANSNNASNTAITSVQFNASQTITSGSIFLYGVR